MRQRNATLTIEKPTQCNVDCPIFNNGICQITKNYVVDKIPNDCPLKEERLKKVNVIDFTKKEEEYFIKECGFTNEELRFFKLRKNKTYIEIADIMKISIGTVNNISKRVSKKILKVL